MPAIIYDALRRCQYEDLRRRPAAGHLASSNTNVGVAKRAAGNKITVWRSRRLRGVFAPVAGGGVLVRFRHAEF
jgi:hypothetical protein